LVERYWTMRLTVTLCAAPCCGVAVTVRAYVPAGVPVTLLLWGLPPPQPVSRLRQTSSAAAGTQTRAGLEARTSVAAAIANTRARIMLPIGKTGACGLPGHWMWKRGAAAADRAVVVTFTANGTAVVPVAFNVAGDAVHVAPAGAPVQVMATVPVKPPTGLSCKL